ncbi:MAG: sulfotransferase [Propionibacteriales bacterium]|nr:sulfotransferase [Propionibacteriales bacterium]
MRRAGLQARVGDQRPGARPCNLSRNRLRLRQDHVCYVLVQGCGRGPPSRYLQRQDLLCMTGSTTMTPRSSTVSYLLVGIAIPLVHSLGRLVQQRNDPEQRGARLRKLKRRNARLRAANRSLRAELEEARVGDRGDLRFVFIVTYGRSGSTLLQGILSSIPGYLIRGENGGAAYHLYKFHTIAEHRRKSSRGWRSPRSAWFGIGDYPTQLALRELRWLLLATVIRPEQDSRVVGFKEIKWHQKDLGEYVQFLRAVFPGARFVINTRNLDEVAVSKWWAKRSDAREVLTKTEERILALKASLGDDAYHIHYDDYAQEPDKLRGLFDWLGEEFDEARIKGIMAKKHSY